MYVEQSFIDLFSKGISIAGIVLWIIISQSNNLSDQTKRVASWFCLGMFLLGFFTALYFGLIPDE